MSENTGRPNIISPTSVKLTEVINRHVEVFSADELAVLHSAVGELQAYEGLSATGVPVNVDVPYVEQSGAALTCTMGNWEGEPDQYEYQWRLDGVDVPGEGDTLPVTSADAGKLATCVVTASNATGSTEAPPSNEVTVTDPG